jgi:3D (Asp-Asp-Asp) domain-containing protein
MIPIKCEAPAEAVQPEVVDVVQEVEVIETEPPEPVVEPEPEKITFRITAYCSCYECCGEYALNRPKDENGHEIVTGASGKRLIANYSCASTYPFGTKIEVDGLGTFEVQDRTAKWVVEKYGENLIDIYVDNHQDIAKIGRQFLEGVIVE